MVNIIGKAEGRPTPLLSLVWKLQQSADELLLKADGVGLSQTRIMAALDKSVPYSQRKIAVELGQTEANVSRQLKQMKKHGLVTITKNKKDHRQRDVTLTPKGYRTYQKNEKLLRTHQKDFLRPLKKNDSKNLESIAKQLA